MNKVFNLRIILILILLLSMLLYIIINCCIFFGLEKSTDMDYSERLIVINKLINRINNENCELIDINNETKNHNYFYFYKTDKKTCPYEILYAASTKNSKIKSISDKYISKFTDKNKIKYNYNFGVHSAYLQDIDYQIILYNKVSFFYLKTTSTNKLKAYKILTDLGYKKKMYDY